MIASGHSHAAIAGYTMTQVRLYVTAAEIERARTSRDQLALQRAAVEDSGKAYKVMDEALDNLIKEGRRRW